MIGCLSRYVNKEKDYLFHGSCKPLNLYRVQTMKVFDFADYNLSKFD